MEVESEKVMGYVDQICDQHPEAVARCDEDVRRKMRMSKGQEEKIAALPLEDTIWLIKEMEKETQEDGSTHRYLCMVDRSGVAIGVTSADVSLSTFSEHSYDLVCYCTLFPMARQARRPRICTYMDKTLAREHQLDLNKLGITFVSPGLSETPSESVELPWMRECHMCRLRGTPGLFKTCSSCQAVIYCSRECQKQSWSQKGDLKPSSHKLWCGKMKGFMSKSEQLAALPFTFAAETTSVEFDILRCRKFLEERGMYNQGLWRRECALWTIDGNFIEFGNLPECEDLIVLPVESSILESAPDNKPPVMADPFRDWETFYRWRGFRLDSPIAALLHFPLTLYYILTTCLPRDYPGMELIAGKHYVVDLLGVEKEVEMISLFKVVMHLLPDVTLTVNMIGKEICKSVDGREFSEGNLTVVMHLLPDVTLTVNMIGKEICKSVDGREFSEGNLTVHVHRMLYHSYSGVRPHIAIGFNAGLAAYQNWMQSVKKLKVNNIPAYLTDYCQHSCECAKTVVEDSQLGSCSAVEINPFHTPFRKVCEDNNVPWYSNAFIYRLTYANSFDS